MKEAEDYISTGEIKFDSGLPQQIINLIQSCISLNPENRPDIFTIEKILEQLMDETYFMQFKTLRSSHSLTNLNQSKPRIICPVHAKQPYIWHSISMSKLSKVLNQSN